MIVSMIAHESDERIFIAGADPYLASVTQIPLSDQLRHVLVAGQSTPVFQLDSKSFSRIHPSSDPPLCFTLISPLDKSAFRAAAHIVFSSAHHRQNILAGDATKTVGHFIDCEQPAHRLPTQPSSPFASRKRKMITSTNSTIRSRCSMARSTAVALLATAFSLCTAISAFAADTIVLRVGDQKGGNRSLLEISGLAKDLPYKIEWSEFPAAAPILEALNAGALDVGYTGDLAFLSVYAAGAPIKAIGGTRSDARTQAILVRKDSPIKTAADLRGKRLAGTRGGWGQFLIDATLEKTGNKIEDATFAPLGPVDAKIALLAGSIDGWAVWEPYVSYATLKDGARVVADGEGLTPTITFIVASDQAIATKRAALQD